MFKSHSIKRKIVRKIAEALAFADETTAVQGFKVVPLCQITHTQTGARRLGRVPGDGIGAIQQIHTHNQRT